jgi:hypothetical protein
VVVAGIEILHQGLRQWDGGILPSSVRRMACAASVAYDS